MLIDEILESRAIEEWSFGLPAEELRRLFQQAFVVRCQNVWDYFSANLVGKSFTRDQFPNVAPSMPKMWFEWTTEPIRIEDPTTVIPQSGRIKFGVLCLSVDLFELDTEGLKTIRERLERVGIKSLMDTRWVVSGLVFSRVLLPGETPRALSRIDWRSGPNGECLSSAANGDFANTLAPDFEGDKDAMFTSILTAASVCWQALSFMHCKNVRVEKSPAIPEKLRRARERNGKHPLFRHHTVIIDPSRPATGSAANDESEGSEQALHICRGHFKDFRERGLFGRQRGIYWWPMHARGSAENGTIGKDYEVRS